MIRLRLLTLMVLLLAGLNAPLAAASPGLISQLEKQIKQLDTEGNSPSPLQELYQRTLIALQEQQQYQQRADALQEQLERQPAALEQQQRLLEQPLTPVDLQILRSLDTTSLEQQLTLRRAALLQLEQRRDQLLQQAVLYEQKQLSLREQLAELRRTPPVIPPLADDAGRQLADARLQLQNALQERHNSQIQVLELELLTLPGESELTRLELRQVKRQISSEREQLVLMQQLLEQKRQDELEATLSDLIQAGAQASQPGPIRELIEYNRSLTEQLSQLNEQSADTNRARLALEQELELVSQSLQTIRQQLELDSYNASYELRRFTKSLSRPVDTSPTRQTLNTLRLSSLDFNRLRTLHDEPNESTEASLTTAQRRQLDQLRASRDRLLNRFQERRQQLIGELSQLLTVQEQLNDRIAQAQGLIARQLLWLPTVPPLSTAWPGEVLSGVDLLLQQLHILRHPSVWNNSLPLGMIVILSASSLLLAFWLQRYQRRHRARWARELGNVVHDRFTRTLRLCLLAPLVAAPLPLLFLLLRKYSLNPDHPDHLALQQLMLFWSLSLLLYGTLIQWLRVPDGLFCGHFATPAALAIRLKRQLHLLFLTGTPLLSLIILIDSYNSPELQTGIGRLAFLLLTLVLILFWRGIWRVSHELNQMTQSQRWWHNAQLWITLLILFNAAMFLLGAWGYMLTALFLMLILTVVILQILGAFLIFKLGLRWLLIAERRLAFSRARARRAEIQAARENNEESPPPLKENYLDLQTISDQSRILLKSLTLLLLGIMLWLTLGDFLPTLQVLESVQLWSSTSQLINWSLSDAITRLVITLGIAYGSDTEQAEQLLLEIARDNPRVLDDPEPSAYFRAFGDSGLQIDLRVFVSSLSDRIPVTDELNKEIHKRFAEHQIEIAFPQLDVHLRNDS